MQALLKIVSDTDKRGSGYSRQFPIENIRNQFVPKVEVDYLRFPDKSIPDNPGVTVYVK